MVNVDISNVWTCVSLPELLGSEKDVFDAHNLLRDNTDDGPDFMNWLRMSTAVCGRMIHGVNQAARVIAEQSDYLVVCGSGGGFHGTKAAIEAMCGANHLLRQRPRILFVGTSLSARQWAELSRFLQDKDYSVFLMSADAADPSPNVTARALRWMMERKYGADAKKRIFVATMVGTPWHTMAQEEGYELFPLPKEAGGKDSALTAASLVPMAVAGIDPLAVLEGAVDSYKELDIRSFENPAWLYAAARTVLKKKGKDRELLCMTDHDLRDVGDWWQRVNWRQQSGIAVQSVLLPGDLEAMDDMAASPDSHVFETVLRFTANGKKVPVEMDWKDYDGLGFLSGKTADYVEQSLVQAMVQTHNDAGVPVIDVDAGAQTAENLGSMLYFFELSAALTAGIQGNDPFVDRENVSRQAAISNMMMGM